jgi:poly(hydroxyalkanoate) depolymerase family esterase
MSTGARRLVIAIATLLAVLAALTGASAGMARAAIGTAWASAPATFSGVYANVWGARHYRGYVPSTYRPGTPMPLLVGLPGCTETGAAFERLTGLSRVAERRGFIVVYPEQSILANPGLCWNWPLGVNQVRGSGEPSIIAGITDAVRSRYPIDPRRIFVTGASAGGVLSVIMAVTYPDVYAAAGVVAGCEYRCDILRLRSPDAAGNLAYRQMAGQARPVPVIVFHGSADPVVPVATAARIVGQWAQTDDLALNGVDDGDMDAVADRVVTDRTPGGRDVVHSTYTSTGSQALIEEYLVGGAGHAWPGGCSCDVFGDPAGPDASALQWDFFAAHPR